MHSEYVIIVAFPLRQWFHERACMLRYTYIAWLVMTEAECVYIAARQKSLNKIQVNISI